MNSELKDVKERIRSYFGDVKNEVRVFRYHSHRIIAVEYEDFRAEKRVEDDLRELCGDSYLLTVKRECSQDMICRILRFVMGEGEGSCFTGEENNGHMDYFGIMTSFEP